MRKVVAVLVVVALALEPSLGAVHSARVASTSQSGHQCYLESVRGFKDFLFSPPPTLSDLERGRIAAEVQEKCKAVPVRLSSFPPAFVAALRDLPIVRFVMQRLESSPEHKLALVSQHHALATLDLTAPTALVQLDARGNTVGIAPKLQPFWVKGDPGSSNTLCYLSHFSTYVVSWVLVGAFLCNLFQSATSGLWGPMTERLGLGAFVSQGLYALALLACGLAEEARTQMSKETKCNFHKRYLINFAIALLLGFFWMLARKSSTDYVEDNESMEDALAHAKQPNEDNDDKQDGGKGTKGAPSHDQLAQEDKAMEGGQASRVQGVVARALNRKFALPFLLGALAAILSFALLC